VDTWTWRGTAVAQWLRCCATNRKVTCSIPAGVSGFFIDIKFFDRTMVLGSTKPLTEMSTRSISVRLTTLPPSCAIVIKSGNLHFLEPSGPVQASNGSALPLPLHGRGNFVYSYWRLSSETTFTSSSRLSAS